MRNRPVKLPTAVLNRPLTKVHLPASPRSPYPVAAATAVFCRSLIASVRSPSQKAADFLLAKRPPDKYIFICFSSMAYSRINSTLSQAFRLFSKWAEEPITAVPAAEISQTQSRIPPFDWASLTSTDNSTFSGETAPSKSTGARALVSGFISLSNSEGGGNPLEGSTTILSEIAALRQRLEALENNFYAANGIFLRFRSSQLIANNNLYQHLDALEARADQSDKIWSEFLDDYLAFKERCLRSPHRAAGPSQTGSTPRQCLQCGTFHDGNRWPVNYQDQHRARQTRTKIVRRSQQ